MKAGATLYTSITHLTTDNDDMIKYLYAIRKDTLNLILISALRNNQGTQMLSTKILTKITNDVRTMIEDYNVQQAVNNSDPETTKKVNAEMKKAHPHINKAGLPLFFNLPPPPTNVPGTLPNNITDNTNTDTIDNTNKEVIATTGTGATITSETLTAELVNTATGTDMPAAIDADTANNNISTETVNASTPSRHTMPSPQGTNNGTPGTNPGNPYNRRVELIDKSRSRNLQENGAKTVLPTVVFVFLFY